MEKVLERKITGGLFGMKNGTKNSKEVFPWLIRLRPINPALYEDFFNQYKDILAKLENQN